MSERTWAAKGCHVTTGWDCPFGFLLLIHTEADKPLFDSRTRRNPAMSIDEIMMVLKQHGLPHPPTLEEDLGADKANGERDLRHDYGDIRCNININVGTIGDRPCEIVLNKILVERRDKKLTNKVMALHLEFRDGLKHLTDIQDVAFRKRMLDMWRERCLEKLDSLQLPEVVHTHLGCALMANWRDYQKEHGLAPDIRKKKRKQDKVNGD